ncbi:hypothetical protein EON65_55690, partial [archaeon]
MSYIDIHQIGSSLPERDVLIKRTSHKSIRSLVWHHTLREITVQNTDSDALRSLEIAAHLDLRPRTYKLTVSLAHLEVLDLSSNKLGHFLSSTLFSHLPALKELIFHHNELAEVDLAALAPCKQLSKLDLSCNLLQSLPPSVGTLRSLTELRLQSNRLAQLPREIASLPDIRVFNAKGNHLVSPPQVTLDSGG